MNFESPDRNKRMKRWSCLAALVFLIAAGTHATAQTSEPSRTPILRIETGMHTARIRSIDIDGAGKFLVTGSDDKTARVWDVRTGELLRVLRVPIATGNEGKLYAVAISPDGRTIAVGGDTGDERARINNAYIFDRESGKLVRRLTGMPDVISHLSFSPDGSLLAATLLYANGVRSWRTSDWTEVGRDTDYNVLSMGADFDRSNRLVTSCFDGNLRLYDRGMRLLLKQPAPGGKQPRTVAFSSDGLKIAVGYLDSGRVDILSGETLSLLYSADTTGINGDLSSVAWSNDGAMLYAAGNNRDRSGLSVIRRWNDAGRGTYVNAGVANTTADIAPLPGGGLVYGTDEPAWGVLDAQHKETSVRHGPEIADYHDTGNTFLIDAHAAAIGFSYEPLSKPSVFRFSERTLTPNSSSTAELRLPMLQAPGLSVTDWEGSHTPRVNGVPLKLKEFELSQSLAVAPDGQRFLLGTGYSIRLFNRSGEEIWAVPSPGTSWAVNISGDGQVALAAFGDGTIRWYRMTDGKELLAFFPHKDRKRWVAWTTEGYYDASPGAEGLLGWHVNNGRDQAADFYQTGQFFEKFYQPKLLAQALTPGGVQPPNPSDRSGVNIANGPKQPPLAISGAAPQPELIVQTGHSDFVESVAFSPDGRLVASSSVDQSIKLWDTASGQEIRTLSGHSKAVHSVAFSPDGTLLASASDDNTVKLWDISTGSEVRTLNRHSAGVTSVAFSPDGKTLASGGYDTSIKLWDVSTGTELRTLKVPAEWIYSVAFSPDGKVLAGGSGPEKSAQELIASVSNPKKDDPAHPSHGTVKLWNVATGQEIRTFSGHTKDVRSVAFSPDGKLLASGSEDKTIKLWDMANGQEIRSLSGHSKTVQSVVFAPDGKQLASGSVDGTIKLWDTVSGQESRTLYDQSIVSSLAFSRDGKQLASGSWDRTIKLWDLPIGLQRKTLSGHSSNVYSVAFSPDGKLLAIGQDKTIKLWDTEGGHEIQTLSGHSKFVTSLAFSPDSKLLASGSWDETIKFWNTTTGKEIKTLSGHSSHVLSVAFSPDGKLLVSGSRDKTVRLWDVARGQEIRTFSGHSGFVTSVAFSPDGKLLASGSWDQTVKLWDVTSGQVIRTLQGNDLVDSVAFSPDGTWLASGGGGEGTINLWDAATGQVIRTLAGHSSSVESVTFSPDGKLLASGSADQTIKLWDPASGREIKTLSGHSGIVRSVAFNPNGKLLMSGSSDTKIKVWEISSAAEIASLIALDEKDWIVVTPDGLFDGSPVVWNKIIWRFNNNTFNYAPVEAFFSDFYYPGLLTEVVEGKRMRAAKQISQKDRRQPRLQLSYSPPKAQATPNQPGDKVTDDDLNRIWAQIKARAAQEVGGAIDIKDRETTIKIGIPEAVSGAQDVRLFRNGSLVKVWHGDVLKGQSSVTLEATISVVAGENRLTAYAFNHDNIKSGDATLTISGAESLKRKGVAYILAVGVNEYANANYNLKYAVADAQDFADELKLQQARLSNYERVNVISLNDKDATKANILKSLADLSVKVQPEDALVIFFAGHGTAQQNRFYLIPHDLGYTGSRTQLDSAGLQSILSHSISDEELEKAVEGVDAGQMLLVIDACNSGQALEAEEKRRGPMNSKGLAQLAYEKGMYILTAAQSYQAANEAAKFGHGFLTYALVEDGLKTNAADNEPKDGQVLLREWLDFAAERVPQMQQDELTSQLRQGRQLDRIKFADSDSGNERSVQRPRVFYRRETEAKPLVVAKPN